MTDHPLLTPVILGAGLVVFAAITATNRQTATGHSNPLIAPWTGPYGGVPPWDQAKPELFPEAFEAALAEQRAEINVIASDPSRADVRQHDRGAGALRTDAGSRRRVCSACCARTSSTPEIQALDREWQPKLAAAEDAIVFNPAIVQAHRDRVPVAGDVPR